MNAAFYTSNLPMLRNYLQSNAIQGAFLEKLESRRAWAVYEGPRPLGIGGFLVDVYRTKRGAAAMVAQINDTITALRDDDHEAASEPPLGYGVRRSLQGLWYFGIGNQVVDVFDEDTPLFSTERDAIHAAWKDTTAT